MPEKKPVFFLLSVAVLFIGVTSCTPVGYDFTTDAEYALDKSKVHCRIHAEGRVQPGEDTGTGKATARVYGPLWDDTLFVEIEGSNIVSISYGDSDFDPVSVSDIDGSFMTAIGFTPCKTCDMNEFEELVAAIKMTVGGPKGTLEAGQTKNIRVVNVSHTRF